MSHKRKNEAPDIEPLDWERAVEIATPGNAPVDLDEFNRLGKAAQGITTLKTDNGREVHKRPDGRFISAGVAEAIRSEADPESQKLGYDERETIKEKLEAIQKGELPSGTKRDFTLNKDEQLKQVRIALERELTLSNQLVGLDHETERQRHEKAAKNIAKLKDKRALRERELLNAELKKTQEAAYEVEMANLEPELQKKIAELEGTSEERYHKSEQLKLEARKAAKQRAEEIVEERKQTVEEAGGPGTINKLNEKEADERKKAEFREWHGVGEKRNVRPKRDPQSINDGRAPVKPDHVSSQDWWAMTGEQRRNKLRDPKHIWFDKEWAERYDQLDSADFDAQAALDNLKRQWLVEIGAIDRDDSISLDQVDSGVIGAALTRKANTSFGGDMNKLKEWARSGEWVKLDDDNDDVQPPTPLPPVASPRAPAVHATPVTPLPPITPTTSVPTTPSAPIHFSPPTTTNPSNPRGSKLADVMEDAADLTENHFKGLGLVGAGVLAEIFADASAPKVAAFTLLTGVAVAGSKRMWNKANSVARGIGASVVGLVGSEMITGGYYEKGNLIAAGLGAGFGLGYAKGKKLIEPILERIGWNDDPDAKRKRIRWAKVGAIVAMTVAITSSAAYTAIQGNGSGAEETDTPTASTTFVGPSTSIESAPTSTAAVNSDDSETSNSGETNVYEDPNIKQRDGVRARAIELGVTLSDSQINKIVSDAFGNLYNGNPADFEKLTANPEIAKVLTDHAILEAAGISS